MDFSELKQKTDVIVEKHRGVCGLKDRAMVILDESLLHIQDAIDAWYDATEAHYNSVMETNKAKAEARLTRDWSKHKTLINEETNAYKRLISAYNTVIDRRIHYCQLYDLYNVEDILSRTSYAEKRRFMNTEVLRNSIIIPH